MLLSCYSTMAILPIYILRWLNLIYSAAMLWVYQCYVEMIISESFNGLIIKKNSAKTILYVHSGFYGLSTNVNDLGFNIDLSCSTGLTILTVDYDNQNLEAGLDNIFNAYSWLKERSEEVVIMGAGVGCYLIEMLLSRDAFQDRSEVVFLSPITHLDICVSKACQDDTLNFNAVKSALDSCMRTSSEIDLKTISKKITRLFVAYGENDLFSYYTKKFIDRMKKLLKSVSKISSKDVGHCYMMVGHNAECDLCLHKLDRFLND